MPSGRCRAAQRCAVLANSRSISQLSYLPLQDTTFRPHAKDDAELSGLALYALIARLQCQVSLNQCHGVQVIQVQLILALFVNTLRGCVRGGDQAVASAFGEGEPRSCRRALRFSLSAVPSNCPHSRTKRYAITHDAQHTVFMNATDSTPNALKMSLLYKAKAVEFQLWKLSNDSMANGCLDYALGSAMYFESHASGLPGDGRSPASRISTCSLTESREREIRATDQILPAATRSNRVGKLRQWMEGHCGTREMARSLPALRALPAEGPSRSSQHPVELQQSFCCCAATVVLRLNTRQVGEYKQARGVIRLTEEGVLPRLPTSIPETVLFSARVYAVLTLCYVEEVPFDALLGMLCLLTATGLCSQGEGTRANHPVPSLQLVETPLLPF